MSDLWVFGYASLMWHPGFAHAEAVHARLPGFHRALCVYSVHYRGTSARPGLVFGLDQGGACDGMAFRVAADDRLAGLRYLHGRELVTGAYRPERHAVGLRDGSGRAPRALCYVADHRARQYAAGHAPAEQAAIVRESRGAHGRNIDYVLATARHLHELGIRDREIERLTTLLGLQWRVRAESDTCRASAAGHRDLGAVVVPRRRRVAPLPAMAALRHALARRIRD